MQTKTMLQGFCQVTNHSWFGILLFLLRISLGFMFLYSGIAKLDDWSAAFYLVDATGPFAEWFQSLANNALIDSLNVWGQVLIGACLILGIVVRPASFFGAILMALYYLAQFDQNTAHGFVDQHVIMALIFVMFMAGGVGHILGLDGLVSGNIRKKKWFTKILFG
ncbi:MAG: DoxX family protein [Candidatus Uhrbacteria bacterium]|nr:DoxX family protein [Candidatus Uhrbacteria bacterium]